jgi:hypothetical protein
MACVALLLSKDIHPECVEELLGNASTTLSSDIYSHVLLHEGSGYNSVIF